MATLTFSGGKIVAWKYEWSDFTSYVDNTGNNQISGSLLPTPSDTRSSGTAVTSFTWHHTAPAVCFTITSSGATIKIKATKVASKYNYYSYTKYNPVISFYYEKNSKKVLIGSFSYGNSSYKSYNGGTASVSTSDLAESYIYVNCSASTCSLYKGSGSDTYHKLGKLKLHTHISAPAAPTVSTTGKTITVTGGDQVRDYDDDTWYDSSHKFTGLKQGTTYKYQCREKCSCDKYYNSSTKSAKTWKISISLDDNDQNSLSYTATHTAGTGGTASSKTITYELYEGTSKSGTAVKTTSGASGSQVTFTGLTAGKTYYCYAYTTGITDNTCGKTGKTTNMSLSCTKSTGKTLKFKATASNSSGTITYKLYKGSTLVETKTGIANKSSVTFTSLDQGTTYKCVAYSEDDTSNSDEETANTWGITASVTSTTGKTIKIKATVTVGTGGDDEDILYELYENGDNSNYIDFDYGNSGKNVTFYWLDQGATYNCKIYIEDVSTDTAIWVNDIKTWNMTSSVESKSISSITFKATHTAGTGGTASSKTITYKLCYYEDDDIDNAIETKTGASGSQVTFTGLDSSTIYSCYIYTTGMTDNDSYEVENTGEEFTEGSTNSDVSATTLRFYTTWVANDSVGIKCTYTCSNGYSLTIDTSGKYFVVTGLTPGSDYTINYIITDNDDNTIYGVSDTMTTKKTSFSGDVDITSKIIKYSAVSNYSGDTIQLKFGVGTWLDKAQGTGTYNNLVHNTTYTLCARIKNCYAFNSDGTASSTNDSEISKTATTYELTFAGMIEEEHQHSVKTIWQAKVNGENIDTDVLDGTKFTFSSMQIKAVKESGYQMSEVTEGTVGSCSGDYQTDKTVTSSDLTWYYCKYIVTVAITDGYNIVSASVEVHTTFPYSWIYVNNAWHKAMPHVYSGGKYVPAPCFVYNGKYIEPNGE
jgi:hypothetical protein